MARERLLGSFLVRFTELRFTEHGGVPRVRLQDLRSGVARDFGAWVAAWAYVDDKVERLRARRVVQVDAME